jgi:hypothetical protein
MNITFHWPTIVGLIGMLLVLLAYFLLQVRTLHGNGVVYLLMNAVGSAMIIVSLIYAPNLPSLVLEIVWLLISIYGLARGKRGPSLPT